jgi:superfamily II DNA or RNA helicase
LEGLFGLPQQVATTKELMERGRLAKLFIKCVVLKYSDEERKAVAKLKEYHEELAFLIAHQKRNKFIRNLAVTQERNTMVLFARVETHGKVLYDMIREKAPNRKVFFVHGGVDAEDRETIRKLTEKESNAIIVASYGVFSTGVNIKNLHSVIFASPMKSKIRNLQSIGRGLRVTDGKESCILYDIGDDLQWKSRSNYSAKHLVERISIYSAEEFEFSISDISLA